MNAKVAVRKEQTRREKFIKDFIVAFKEMAEKNNLELRNRDKMAMFYVEKCSELLKNFDPKDPSFDPLETFVLDTLESLSIMIRFVK